MSPIDPDDPGRAAHESGDDPLEAALRALPLAAPADGDAFTAAVMQRIAHEPTVSTDRMTPRAGAHDSGVAGPTLSATDALRRAQCGRARAQRRARWMGASVLVGSAVGAAVTFAFAGGGPAAGDAGIALGLRPAAAAATLALLLTWAALRGGLR